MNGYGAALWSEGLKIRKSSMLWATMVVFAFIALMMGILMMAAKNPELAGKSAVLSTKASFIQKTDWPSYFSLILQIVLTAGYMGYGIVTGWVFGREYSDKVIKDILALPVSRHTLVLAKFTAVFLWNVLLSLITFGIALLAGIAAGLEGWSASGTGQAFVTFSVAALFTILCCTPVALIASLGRGYLLSIGYVILTLIITQFAFVGFSGIIPYFPIAIPALYSGVTGPAFTAPGTVSYLIFFGFCLAGIAGTLAWWRFADQQ